MAAYLENTTYTRPSLAVYLENTTYTGPFRDIFFRLFRHKLRQLVVDYYTYTAWTTKFEISFSAGSSDAVLENTADTESTFKITASFKIYIHSILKNHFAQVGKRAKGYFPNATHEN